jgi:hypothetical protein
VRKTSVRRGFCSRPRVLDKAFVSTQATFNLGYATQLDFVMPRYFFNTRIDDEQIVDPDGEELRNPDRAWEVARSMILEVFKSEGTQAALLDAVIEVTDAQGEIVLEFPFTEALLNMPDQSATRH